MEKHNLLEDFPEFKDKIHDLKTSHEHFKKLYNEYDVVNQNIHRIETGAETVGDALINELHMKRVHLKDQLYSLLKSN
jgi:uncharacterized protein